MRICLIALAFGVFALIGLSFAHGWVEDPPARQRICSQQGGQWWPENGEGIPNEACREAYQLRLEPLLYTQTNEYAANVQDYNNQNAVEQEVQDGLLCSAGRERYAGMSISHTAWQRTSVKGGKYTLKFTATAPHTPSFWQIYISKADFDPETQVLNWDDLELLNEFSDIALDASIAGYAMNIDLPQNRPEGHKAILFTRWQRIDTAGEGFYNCSDIVFGESNVTTNPPNPNTPTPIPTPNPTQPTNTQAVDVLFTMQDSWASDANDSSNSGFNGIILISNKSDAPISDWRFSFKLAAAASVNETVWGAGGSIQLASDGVVSISPNLLGGKTIQPGAMATIFYGGLGSFDGASLCSFNGKDCLVKTLLVQTQSIEAKQ